MDMVTGVEGVHCRGLLQHRLTGLWSTKAKVDGIMLKAARHWGSSSSVINNTLGKSGRNPLCVGLPSAWSSVEVTAVFRVSWGSLNRDSKRYEGMNEIEWP
jgi:hypothetical protein